MGCTLSELRHRHHNNHHTNIFKVFNVDIDGVYRNPGKLEITTEDLIFHHKNKEPIRWPLRYLRRYGFDEDLFSFESGRRCPTGPGIYAFKCSRASALFELLQECIQRAGGVGGGGGAGGGIVGQHDDAAVRPVSLLQTDNHTQTIDSNQHSPSAHALNMPAHGVISLADFPQISNSLHEYINHDAPPHSASRHNGARTSMGIDLSRQVSLQSEPEPQIQYAQLDLGADEEVESSHRGATPALGAMGANYMNMPKQTTNGGMSGGSMSSGGLSSGGMSLSSSVPLIEAPPLPPLLEEDSGGEEAMVNYLNLGPNRAPAFMAITNKNTSIANAASGADDDNGEMKMTYIQVDFKDTESSGDASSLNNGRTLGNGNLHSKRGEGVRNGGGGGGATPQTIDSYAVIDFNKTAAISAMLTQQTEEEGGGRKTRHNSSKEFENTFHLQ